MTQDNLGNNEHVEDVTSDSIYFADMSVIAATTTYLMSSPSTNQSQQATLDMTSVSNILCAVDL